MALSNVWMSSSPSGVCKSLRYSMCSDVLVWSIAAKALSPSRPMGLQDRFSFLSEEFSHNARAR